MDSEAQVMSLLTIKGMGDKINSKKTAAVFSRKNALNKSSTPAGRENSKRLLIRCLSILHGVLF